jgi:hypothetical protein
VLGKFRLPLAPTWRGGDATKASLAAGRRSAGGDARKADLEGGPWGKVCGVARVLTFSFRSFHRIARAYDGGNI